MIKHPSQNPYNATTGADQAILSEVLLTAERIAELRDVLDELEETCLNFAQAIASGESGWELLIGRMESGGHMQDRETLSSSIERLQAQRHRLQVEVMRAWLADGRTITAYAELYGFSRQYAARIARDARA